MSTHLQSPRLICVGADWCRWQPLLPPLAELGGRSAGHVVTDQHSSWVRRIDTPSGSVFVKTYAYPQWRHRVANLARYTAPFRRSRPQHEFAALIWLGQHGFPTPEPLAVLEHRQGGFLTAASLVTAAFPGQPASAILPAAPPAARRAIGAAIGQLVGRLHALGFRDRNLDLRNLLVHRRGADLAIAKIDSPRHRLVRPGRREDRWTRADWARLGPQLAAFDIAAAARAAAAR